MPAGLDILVNTSLKGVGRVPDVVALEGPLPVRPQAEVDHLVADLLRPLAVLMSKEREFGIRFCWLFTGFCEVFAWHGVAPGVVRGLQNKPTSQVTTP